MNNCSTLNTPAVSSAKFPDCLLAEMPPILSQNATAFMLIDKKGKLYALRVGDKQANNFIRSLAHTKGVSLRKADLCEINEYLIAHAEISGVVNPVWSRVALISGGIELDIGDADNSRIRVTAGKVEMVSQGSQTLFYRNPNAQPMVIPAEIGDLRLLLDVQVFRIFATGCVGKSCSGAVA